MPRASAADAARTAEHILDSATGLFASRGFSAVSLDDVARASAVTRGAVYHHYRSKVGLFRAVAARMQSDVADAVARAADVEGASAHERLRGGSHAFLDAITSPSMVRVLLVDAPAVIGWQEWRRLDGENSGTHLRDALDGAGVAGDILDAMTAQLSGAMNEAALWVAQERDEVTARERAHTALDRLLSAISAVT